MSSQHGWCRRVPGSAIIAVALVVGACGDDSADTTGTTNPGATDPATSGSGESANSGVTQSSRAESKENAQPVSRQREEGGDVNVRRYGNGFAVMLPPRFDEGQSATMRLEMSETSTVEHSGPLPMDDEERSGIFDASFDVFDVRDGIAAVEIAFERCEVDGVEWWRDMYDDCDGRAGTERVHDDGRMMTHIMGIVGGNAGGDIVFPTEPVAAGAVWTTTEELFIAMIDGLEVTARFELTELTDDHYVLERAINVEIDHETEYQHHTGRFRSTTEIRGSRYDPLAVEATGSYRARVRSESTDLGSESTRVTEGEFTVSQR